MEWSEIYFKAVSNLEPLPECPEFLEINRHCTGLHENVDLEGRIQSFVANGTVLF